MELSIIQSKIHEIRGCRVMLDFDLAEMYGIETKRLKESVRRNIGRFEGSDFMFELTKPELNILRSQIATSSWGGSRYQPFAFTELGVAMLSSVLNSEIAIYINRRIMRAFVMMRQMITGYEELRKRIEELEISTDAQFLEIYQALTELLSKKQIEEKQRSRIGYKASYNSE